MSYNLILCLVQILAPFEVQIRPTDTDVKGHVNNTVYFQYLQLARWDWLAAQGIYEKGFTLVVVHNEIDYRVPITYHRGAKAYVKTSMMFEGEKKIVFRQTILLPNNTVAASATVVMLAIDPVSKKSVPIPRSLKEGISMFKSVEALKAFAASYKRDLLLSMTTNPEESKRLEAFLGVKICNAPKKQISATYTRRNHEKYKQRLMNTRGEFTPTWEMYTSPNDKKRSPTDYEKTIKEKQSKAIPLDRMNNSDSITQEPPDPMGLTAVLNIIHSINPSLCELTEVSGTMPTSKKASHKLCKRC